MSISFSCPSCGHKLRAGDEAAGKRAKCKCGRVVLIPKAPAGRKPASEIALKPKPAAEEMSEDEIMNLLRDGNEPSKPTPRSDSEEQPEESDAVTKDRSLFALVLRLKIGNPLARREAAATLGEIGPPAPADAPTAWVDALTGQRSQMTEEDFYTLEVIPSLIAALEDRDSIVCLRAATALGKIGSATMPALVEALLEEALSVGSGPPARWVKSARRRRQPSPVWSSL
jgi:hypothetical protein